MNHRDVEAGLLTGPACLFGLVFVIALFIISMIETCAPRPKKPCDRTDDRGCVEEGKKAN